jgi:hypothetical protein
MEIAASEEPFGLIGVEEASHIRGVGRVDAFIVRVAAEPARKVLLFERGEGGVSFVKERLRGGIGQTGSGQCGEPSGGIAAALEAIGKKPAFKGCLQSGLEAGRDGTGIAGEQRLRNAILSENQAAAGLEKRGKLAEGTIDIGKAMKDVAGPDEIEAGRREGGLVEIARNETNGSRQARGCSPEPGDAEGVFALVESDGAGAAEPSRDGEQMVALSAAGVQDCLAGARGEPIDQLLVKRPPERAPESGGGGDGVVGEEGGDEQGEEMSAGEKHFACF